MSFTLLYCRGFQSLRLQASLLVHLHSFAQFLDVYGTVIMLFDRIDNIWVKVKKKKKKLCPMACISFGL